MSPHLLKGGFVVLDPASGQVVRILPFQYNPEQLVHAIAPGGETFTLVAEYDATDELEAGRATASEHGIAPQLAALRAIAAERPPAILAFVWGASRIVPVDLLSLTVSETMFDSSLNPLTATVAIELQVVTATAGTDIRARLATAYADEQKELASLVPAGTLAALGVTGLITGELAR
jgi:hypothetical protein